MVNYIWVTARKEMLHYYPDAPKQVEYLRNPHRHIFHIKFYIEIFSDDREIEFIMFKHEVEDLLKDEDIKTMSCEMLANHLHVMMDIKYKNRKMKIEVSEDGENGASMEYDNKYI